MTGFARDSDRLGAYSWVWEVRSVNGRGLDVRSRMPTGHEALEVAVRAAVDSHLSRGNVAVNLKLDRGFADATVRVNEAVLGELVKVAEALAARLPAATLSVDGLLAQRGVVELAETEEDEAARSERERRMLSSFEAALDGLVAMRRQEGARLAEVLQAQLGAIEAGVATAAAAAALQPAALAERLKAQIAAIGEAPEGLTEERLAQEVALLALKADVREELDRLSAHVAAARELIAAGGAVGRRLDFLAQEFNREANTLMSKVSDLELTRVGLELKAAIDQLREQAQNIE
jgi:uncharacterized protein (TIGR00255 family)